MPGGDRTGPGGMGPMTGRAAGCCAGFGVPGYANSVPGRGFGIGSGRGGGFWRRGGGSRGWRNMLYATGQPGWMRFGGSATPDGHPASHQAASPEMERRFLKGQVDALQAEMDAIRKRLADIEAGTAEP